MDKKEIIGRDHLATWRILDNYKSYDTIDKLAKVLNRPVNQEMFKIWHDALSGSAYHQRQVWAHQAIPPNPKCCGQ